MAGITVIAMSNQAPVPPVSANNAMSAIRNSVALALVNDRLTAELVGAIRPAHAVLTVLRLIFGVQYRTCARVVWVNRTRAQGKYATATITNAMAASRTRLRSADSGDAGASLARDHGSHSAFPSRCSPSANPVDEGALRMGAARDLRYPAAHCTMSTPVQYAA